MRWLINWEDRLVNRVQIKEQSESVVRSSNSWRNHFELKQLKHIKSLLLKLHNEGKCDWSKQVRFIRPAYINVTFHSVLTFLDVIRLLKVFWACVTTWSRTIIVTSVSLFVVDDPRESIGPYGERPLSLCDVTKRYFLLIALFLVLFFRRWSQHDWHHWRWDSSMWGQKPRWLEVCGKR